MPTDLAHTEKPYWLDECHIELYLNDIIQFRSFYYISVTYTLTSKGSLLKSLALENMKSTDEE